MARSESVADEILKLNRLKEIGAISEAEFNEQKGLLLRQSKKTTESISPLQHRFKRGAIYLFSFKGRFNRARYWLGNLIVFSLYLLLAVPTIAWLVVVNISSSETGSDHTILSAAMVILGVVLFAAVIVAGLAIATKRLHDRNKSAWWLLLFYIAPALMNAGVKATPDQSSPAVTILTLIATGISLWAFVELGCLPGTAGANRYGPDPLADPNYKARPAIIGAIVGGVGFLVLLLAIGGYFWFSSQKAAETASDVTDPVVAPSEEPAVQPDPSPEATGSDNSNSSPQSTEQPAPLNDQQFTQPIAPQARNTWQLLAPSDETSQAAQDNAAAGADTEQSSSSSVVMPSTTPESNTCGPRSPPSFDCAKAKSGSAKAICASPKLSQVDCNLGKAFAVAAARADANGTTETLKVEEASWVRERDRVCAFATDAENCLETWIERRTEKLTLQNAGTHPE